MIQKTLQEITSMLNAQLIQAFDTDQKVQGVSIDSRSVQQGTLYIPLKGARVDGHSFVEQVKENGASASLWQIDHTPYPQDIPLILVQDTYVALHDLAQAYMSTLSCTVIGITGSNGKTSTKDMMATVLARKGKTQCTTRQSPA